MTGAPGAHPVGTGAGAAAGGVAGAALGSMAGPVGTVAGAVVGAVAGGFAGKAAGEAVNPTEQDGYWRQNFASRPYAKNFQSYDDVAPAYRYGWESASSPAHKGRSFEQSESTLRSDWDRAKGGSAASWDKAKEAVKDAWHRITPGRD
jgi:phage tail tape-measure protein